MLNRSMLFLGCLSIVMSSCAMHYCAPSSEDLKRLGEVQAVIRIDESKQPSTADEWMERAVMYQARAFMADSMGLPQSYDGIEACRCCGEAEKLDSYFVKNFDHLVRVVEVINTYFGSNEKFKQFASSALKSISDEQEELQEAKLNK